jgi:hypothetical protein
MAVNGGFSIATFDKAGGFLHHCHGGTMVVFYGCIMD